MREQWGQKEDRERATREVECDGEREGRARPEL